MSKVYLENQQCKTWTSIHITVILSQDKNLPDPENWPSHILSYLLSHKIVQARYFHLPWQNMWLGKKNLNGLFFWRWLFMVCLYDIYLDKMVCINVVSVQTARCVIGQVLKRWQKLHPKVLVPAKLISHLAWYRSHQRWQRASGTLDIGKYGLLLGSQALASDLVFNLFFVHKLMVVLR